MSSKSSPTVRKAGETENSSETIKRQLNSGSGRNLLQDPLLKRSETMRESEEKIIGLNKERELLLKQRDFALHEAHQWHSELANVRERAVILEAAVVRAEERARVAEVDHEVKEKTALKEKEDPAYDNVLQTQVQRLVVTFIPLQQQSNEKQVFEKGESCSVADDDLLEANPDKSCLSDMRSILVSKESEWSDFQASDARIADVRETSSETQLGYSFPELIDRLEKSKVQRQQSNEKQVFEKNESCSGSDSCPPLSKHADLEENADKAGLSDTTSIPASKDSGLSYFQATDARIADVREISTQAQLGYSFPELIDRLEKVEVERSIL